MPIRMLCVRAWIFVNALILASAAVQAQEVKLRIHTFAPALSNTVVNLLKPWADRVEKSSGGRIRSEIYPSMQLGGKPEQLLDQVRDGVVDVVWAVPGFTPGRFVQIEVFELPFMHVNPVVTNRAIQDFIALHPEEYRAYHVLLIHVHAGTAFHTFKPMRSATDLTGLKIRTPSRITGWMLEAMGAIPVGAPVTQIPEMLSKRIVDGVTIPFEIALPLKVHEMVDHHAILGDPDFPRPNTAVFFFAMNKARYESLSPALQRAIDENSGRHIADWAGQVWTDVEQPGWDAALSSGEIHRLSPRESAALRRMIEQPVHDRWIADVKAKGLDGAALIREARSLIAKYHH